MSPWYASFAQNSGLVLIGCLQVGESVSHHRVTLDKMPQHIRAIPIWKRSQSLKTGLSAELQILCAAGVLFVRNAHSGPLRSKQKVPVLLMIQYSSFNNVFSFRRERETVYYISLDTKKDLLLNGEIKHKANCGSDLSSNYIWKSILFFFAMMHLAYGSAYSLRCGSCISCSTLFTSNTEIY